MGVLLDVWTYSCLNERAACNVSVELAKYYVKHLKNLLK